MALEIDATTERVMVETGKWLKRLRKSKKMSQRAMAAYLSYNINTYWKWENGRLAIPIQAFLAVCRGYKLDPKIEMAKIFCEARV